MNFEFAILDFIREYLSCPLLDSVMKFITFLGDAGWIWILTGVTLLFFKKTRRIGTAICLALIFNLVVTNITLKPLIARTRPFDLAEGIKLITDKPTDFSFPSGHSSASFAASVAIFCNNKKYGAFALVLALLIAFSRLYLYLHFPSDVLAGSIIGSVCGYISYLIIKRIKK